MPPAGEILFVFLVIVAGLGLAWFLEKRRRRG